MGILFTVTFIFIISKVYALSEEDKEFCTFVAEKVFTPGEYQYIDQSGVTVKSTIDPFGQSPDYGFDNKSIIKYEKFEVIFAKHIPETCWIRGQFRDDNLEERWSTVLIITSSRATKISIIPNKAQSDSDSPIQFLQRVEWDKMIGEDRISFKEVWNLDNIKERKRILETCHDEKYGTTKEMMTGWRKELQALISQPKSQQANDGQQNNDEQKAESKDDGEEKTIFANTCFTVSLTLNLGILWFFVLLYIRNAYCLTYTESQEEYEYEEESIYDFV